MKNFKLQMLLFCWSLTATVAAQSKSPFIPEPGEGLSINSLSMTLLGAPANYEAAPLSNSQEVFLMRDHIIGLSHFAYALGVGYSAHFYDGNLFLSVDQDGTMNQELLTIGSYRSNRFSTEYVDAAMELRYRSRSNKNGRYTRLYVGGLFGYKTDAYSHYSSDVLRVKYYRLEGFNPYRYGVYAKMGRGPFNAMAYYGLSPIVVSGPMFTDWKDARNLNIGLSITL
jgi:hypothetical protein